MISDPPQLNAVQSWVNEAIGILLKRDLFMLQANVNERSITHKLAEYLQGQLPEWTVDIEYNRDGHESKTLNLPVKNDVQSNDVHARTVFPDIVVHHRNTNENLLVIEVKKSSNPEGGEWDQRKLAEYKRQLGYLHAASICFEVGGAAPGLRIDWLDFG